MYADIKEHCQCLARIKNVKRKADTEDIKGKAGNKNVDEKAGKFKAASGWLEEWSSSRALSQPACITGTVTRPF